MRQLIECGYVAVLNPNDTEGRWKISGTPHTSYGKIKSPKRGGTRLGLGRDRHWGDGDARRC